MRKNISPNIDRMDFNYRIIRSPRRKRIALRIAADDVVEILAPPAVPESFLLKLLEREHAAITSLQQRAQRHLQLDFSENARFLLLGVPYPLHLTNRLRIFDHAFMIPKGTDEEKKSSLIALYRELAQAVIPKRVQIYSEKCGLIPDKVQINSASTRWGSCSGYKTLSFSWKLIQMPLELIDYVAVHELAHLQEMNHSPAFWALVAKIMPDYALRRRKLNELSRTLPRW